MLKNLIIIGAGDFAREITWLIEDINAVEPTYSIVCYLDDDPSKKGVVYKNYECWGAIDLLPSLAAKYEASAVIAMQDAGSRKRIVERFPDFVQWATVVHPSACVADTTTVGVGSILCANVTVSVQTEIGNHCLFNIGSTIGHDCVLGDYVCVMSGACICGHVTVGDGAYLATNSTVIPGRRIGAGATVGAGSAAIRNVRDGVTVIGVPAKVLKL